MDNAKAKLEVEYGEVQENERKIVKELNDKYGPGNLDPATGVFTPSETTESTNT